MFVFDSPALVQITNYYVFSFKRIYLYGSKVLRANLLMHEPAKQQ